MLVIAIALAASPAFGAHGIVGNWSYQHQGKSYQRVFTAAGKCSLYGPTGSKIWTYSYSVVDSRTVDVHGKKGRLRHVLQADGSLRIENQYTARRARIQRRLSGGTAVPSGELRAVGAIRGCTATLITQELVLTAAHCVCPNDGNRTNCSSRSNFLLEGASLAGDVLVHPEYGDKGWLRDDYALIHLDDPAYLVARGVTPIPVEEPFAAPKSGEPLTLVGFGSTGTDCRAPSGGVKRKDVLTTSEVSRAAIRFEGSRRSCPGDSGGPAINSRGRVVGVASWGDGNSSTYRPTHSVYNWIFSAPRSKRAAKCSWVRVGGATSHAGRTWCANGSYLVGLDLDGSRSFSAGDSPIVGRARCCEGSTSWGKCSWLELGRGGGESHSKKSWCSDGSFLTGFDQNGGRGSDHYFPVVGRAQCCEAQRSHGTCFWEEVGAQRSHQGWLDWCPDGTFMVGMDLDSVRSAGAHDSPVIGRVRCCSQ
ncbi:MAG: S1 family peptidase [Acidobacteriota bacterium]